MPRANISYLKNANDAKFTEECPMYTKKYFSKKNIYKWDEREFTSFDLKKKVHGVEIL